MRGNESERPSAASSRFTPSRSVYAVAGMLLLALTWMAVAQQPAAAPAEGATGKAPTSLENLAIEQGKIADKYARLEQLLIRMSELEAATNPQRAALLKRAAQQSSEKLTRQQLNALVKLLAPPAQLKRAVDEQQQVVGDLKALLELLQSENRADRLKSEQARVKDYIKQVDQLIRLQKGVRGRTEGNDDAKKLATDQTQIADRTGQLAKRIQENEESSKSGQSSADPSKSAEKDGQSNKSEDDSKSPTKKGEKSDGSKKDDSKKNDQSSDKADGKKSDKQGDKGDKESQKSDSESSDKGDSSQDSKDKSADGSPKQNQKSSDQKSSGNKKSGEPKNSQKQSQKSGGKPSESEKSGEPSESPQSEQSPDSQQKSEQQQQQPANPARKRLQAAEERMREAEKKLSEAKKNDATDEQQKALEELQKAKAELEQILRQMREEEIERTLAMLEGRFRRMLEAQLKVYESTKRLDKIPVAQRTRDIDIQAGKLGFEEGKLAVEADKALLLLREEGSSVAFPETVEFMRDDMQRVADRLSAVQIDKVTQGWEEDIIQTLEELIAALQKAQQDMKDKKQPPQDKKMQPQDPSQRPLVDKLAELKMIRALQMRVNTRTQRFSRLLENMDDPIGAANDADLRQSLIKLAEMEKKVHEITRNLVLGKNE